MYCVRDADKWYCIDDEVYQRISKSIDGYMSEHKEQYKQFGKEYAINTEGKYELKEQS